MTVPTTDMYTTVERSIYHKLVTAITAASYTYKVFNNMVDKKKFPDQHATICIMKVSDVFTAENGGGAKAFMDAPITVADVVTSFTREPWPDSFNLMYQIEADADNLDDLRKLEALIRTALRPRQPLFLWDSNAAPPAFSTEWIEYQYAGYINRDIPADNIYNRVLNIRFEAHNYQPSFVIPAIAGIDTAFTTDGTTETVAGTPVVPTEVVVGTEMEAEGEIPTLLPDNITYALEHTPLPGTLKAYVGGLRLEEFTDYTLTGKNIVFVLQPPADSAIVCDYTYLQI